MLIKLNLPDSYIRALKSIYSASTGKAALTAFLSSPITFTHDDFLGLCQSIDSFKWSKVEVQSELDEYSALYTLYIDTTIDAKQTLVAFQTEKDMKHE